MSETSTRRQSISFTSLLAFLLGGISGCFFIILICCAFFLSGCKALEVVKRNNSGEKETCVIIKEPSALRICLGIPQPGEPQDPPLQ